MSRLKILLVDDDPNIRQLVNLYLEKEGFEVVMADRGDEALKLFRESPPSLILLDVMLPGMDGWQVCREVRKTSNIPIIMLTAKDETFDKVLGLELGADDYVVKPFDMKELVARIKAVSRRFQAAEPPDRELSFPGLTININQYSVKYMGPEGAGASLLPGQPSRHGVHPGAAAGAGVGIRLLRRFPHCGRARQAPAGEAHRGGTARLDDQDRLGCRL